jgi:hypothetical protein
MIKVGDIVYFHGTCGVVTHISELKNQSHTVIYHTVASDGTSGKQVIDDHTPKDYQLYKTGLHVDMTDMFIQITKAYNEDFVKLMCERLKGE